MKNLFNPTDYDYIVGNTIKQEQLNNEDLFEIYSLEELNVMKDQLISEINNLLLWYYIVADSIRTKETNKVK